MAKQDSLLRLVILLLLAVVPPARAQVVEVPVPFDSAGKVRSLTPALVTRFDLRPPAWPVRGDFVQARLFRSDSAHVLVAERSDGALQRYVLDDAQVGALRNAIDGAMALRLGGVVAEPATEREDVSRGAFLRNQMVLSAAVYGPLIASFANDGKTGTALYLLSTGGSFFLVNNISRNTRVTRVQNDLSTDGTIRGYAAASGLAFAFGGDDVRRQTYSAIGLAGAITGSAVGFKYGDRLTDSEAQAARKFSTLGAATAFAALGAAGVFEDGDNERSIPPAVIAAGALGYAIGPLYPRRARYTVTAGDVRLLHLGALIGLGAGLTPFIGADESTQDTWIAGTIGLVSGTLLADRGWVRRYDHEHSDATLTWLGATAGALIGGAAALLSDADHEGSVVGLLTAGTFLGALGGHAIADPRRANAGGAVPRAQEREGLGSRLRFDPGALAFAAVRAPGRHGIVTLRF